MDKNSINSLISNMLHIADLDKLIAGNLRRIRNERGLTQEKLGELIEVEGTYISQVENALTGLGKDVMARLCNALNIKPEEFYYYDKSPVIIDKAEQAMIYMFREAKPLGVAENIANYGKFIIKETKKPKTEGALKSRNTRHKKG